MSQNTNPKIFEHDATTGEVTQRVVTNAELEAAKLDALAAEQTKATANAKKQEVLAKLGLTAEEAVDLLS